MKKDPAVFLEHVLESISNIESFSKGVTKESLAGDKMRQSAIIRQIEIIGEAIKNIPKDFTGRYPSIPWKDIVGMRDKVIHQYFDIDLDIVWDVIKTDLPSLKEEIKMALENESQSNEKGL